ncbi:hypothetical protein [Algicella marina]|uniref:Uncharacterized protein n=1 Tax=Algicella marina TaxID=2683284 RepID=A0A6P1SYY5_9RHOB|nr:hypothetical protein [Algicella marina]QHQ34229.1 hypothetical protein GO499_02995 [Algicella marina]
MSFETLKASISLLLDQMVNQPEDAHQIEESIREKIAEFRSLGLPVPEDFKSFEASLSRDLARHRG